MGSPKNLKKLSKLAMACLANKPEIPRSPLIHLGLAAKSHIKGTTPKTTNWYLDPKTNFLYLQEAIDYLTCKGKANKTFTAEEKNFLKELYEGFWWGGKAKGLYEAAQLANHYVNGSGNSKSSPLIINPEVYKKSKIVIATMKAMKKYIADLAAKNKSIVTIKSSDILFRRSKYARVLTRMSSKTEGKMVKGGALEAAQNNQRLHKTDGHFYLKALSKIATSGTIQTTWRVDSLYDFEPFKKGFYTNIPLGSRRLKLPDGLSEYMTKIGIAKAFWYRAEWKEKWQP